MVIYGMFFGTDGILGVPAGISQGGLWCLGGSRVHRRPVRSWCPRHLSPGLHSLFARIIFFTQQVPLVKFKSIYNVHQNNQWRVMVITLMTTMTRMMMMMVMLIASTPLYATAHNQRAHPLCKDLLPKWVSCCFSFSYLLRLTTQALRSWSAWRTVIFFTFTWLPSKSCLLFV